MMRIVVLACSLLLALGACSRKTPGDAADAAGTDASLPKPTATGGSVTGMPDRPGPGVIGAPPPAAIAGTDATVVDNPDAVTDADMVPGEADGVTDEQQPGEPTPADAAAVIQDYYRSIDHLDYARAWSLWSDGGRSSGQTLQTFADGFANTAHVTVETGAPGAMEAAAGSRFIQVPVVIEAATRDGETQRYVGTYTLRRAMVDGATAEQRAWRIASASLHAQP